VVRKHLLLRIIALYIHSKECPEYFIRQDTRLIDRPCIVKSHANIKQGKQDKQGCRSRRRVIKQLADPIHQQLKMWMVKQMQKIIAPTNKEVINTDDFTPTHNQLFVKV
jgi:hypothetical protein